MVPVKYPHMGLTQARGSTAGDTGQGTKLITNWKRMERAMRFELTTFTLAR
jgi:hypothetical protein